MFELSNLNLDLDLDHNLPFDMCQTLIEMCDKKD